MLSRIEQLAVELAQEVSKTNPKEVLMVKLPPNIIELLTDLITPPETDLNTPEAQILPPQANQEASLPTANLPTQEDKPYWEKGIPYQK